MTAKQVLEWIKTHEVKRCPFCGGKLEFHDETHIGSIGNVVRKMYFMHDDTECILNDTCMPFTIGCGNSVEDPERWNERKPIEKAIERLEEHADECGKYWNKLDEEDAHGGFSAYCRAMEIVKEEVG